MKKIEVQQILNENLQLNINDFCKEKNENVIEDEIKFQNMKNDFDIMISKFQKLEILNSKKDQDLLELRNVLEGMEKEKISFDIKNNELISNFSKDSIELIESNEKLKNKYEEEMKENEKKSFEMTKIKNKIESLENENESKINEIKTFVEILESKNLQMENSKEEFLTKIQSLENEIKSYDAVTEKLNDQIVEMKSELHLNKTQKLISNDMSNKKSNGETAVIEEEKEEEKEKEKEVREEVVNVDTERDNEEIINLKTEIIENNEVETKIFFNNKSNNSNNNSSNNNDNNSNNDNNRDNNEINYINLISPISTGEIINGEDMEINATKIKLLKNDIESYQITISKLSNELENSKENLKILKENSEIELNSMKNMLLEKRECSLLDVNSLKNKEPIDNENTINKNTEGQKSDENKIIKYLEEIQILKLDFSNFKIILLSDVENGKKEINNLKKLFDDGISEKIEIIDFIKEEKKILKERYSVLEKEYSVLALQECSVSSDLSDKIELIKLLSLEVEKVKVEKLKQSEEHDSLKSDFETSKCENSNLLQSNNEKFENLSRLLREYETSKKNDLIKESKNESDYENERKDLLRINMENESLLKEKMNELEKVEYSVIEMAEVIRSLRSAAQVSSSELELLRVRNPLKCTILHCTVLLYCTVLYSTPLHYAPLHCTTLLYCGVLYFTVLYYTILYYTIL